jgi:hypothetical protein
MLTAVRMCFELLPGYGQYTYVQRSVAASACQALNAAPKVVCGTVPLWHQAAIWAMLYVTL